jgi:hypothetical protein
VRDESARVGATSRVIGGTTPSRPSSHCVHTHRAHRCSSVPFPPQTANRCLTRASLDAKTALLYCTRASSAFSPTSSPRPHARASFRSVVAMSQPHPASSSSESHKAHRTRQAGAKFDKKKAKDKTKRELTQQHKNPRVSTTRTCCAHAPDQRRRSPHIPRVPRRRSRTVEKTALRTAQIHTQHTRTHAHYAHFPRRSA